MNPLTHSLLTLAVIIGLAGHAGAELVASDLNDGGAETGFSDAWKNGSNNVFITTDPDLTYANYGITQTGTTQKIMTSNAGPDRQDVRTLSTAMSGEIWFTVLVNVPTGGNYAGLTFNNTGNSYDPVTTGARVLMGASQLQVGLNGGAATTGTGTFSAGTTHLLLGQMNVAVGNDTLNVWVDPDLTAVSGPGDLPAANFTETTVDFADSITDIGAAGSKGTAAEVYSDAYRLSDTATAFEDVTAAGGPGDTTDPMLAAVDPLSPADDAPAAPVVSDLMVTFDENVAFGTGNITLRTSGGGEVEAFDVANPPAGLTLDGASVTIDPTSDLAASTGYYVEIDATAIDDTSGNSFAGIAGDETWNFTTTSDATPPAVGTLDIPTNGATDVAINSSLVLTFGENVQEGTGKIVIKRTSDDGVVDTIDVTSGNVTIVDDMVTIVPTADLPALTELYVEIEAGAFLDLFENPFAGISGSGTWSFTTAAIPPALVGTDINDGGLDTGFDGGFYNGSNNVFIIEAPDLTYANYGITQTGTTQKVYSANAGPDRQDLRNLTTAMSGEIWFSVLVNIPTGSSYAGLTFNSYGNTYDPVTTAARILMGPNQLQVGFNGEAASTGTGTYAADTTHLLLGQMTVGSGNDTLSVWVDPDLSAGGGLPEADFTATSVDFTDELTILGVAGRKGAGSDVSIDAIRLSNTESAFLDVTGVIPGSDTFQLVITPNGANPGNHDFSWASLDGKLYDLVSSTELSTSPTTWPVWDGRADIAGTEPMNSLSNVPGGGDPTRFFAVLEKDPPPVTLLSENFDGTTPGSLPDDWTSGKNPADNSSLTNWELGTPANVGPIPPGVPLPSGANCVATNIMGNYDDPVSDLGVAHTDIWLRTPSIDLGAATAGTLTFQQWTQIEDVPGDLDYGSIRILDADDDSELAVMEPQSIDGNTTGWEEYSMALPAAAFTAATGMIKVEWQFEGDDIDSFAGWYIDDVAVTVPGS